MRVLKNVLKYGILFSFNIIGTKMVCLMICQQSMLILEWDLSAWLLCCKTKKANYDTDVFTPIINQISKTSGVAYKEKDDIVSMRVIADHIRTLTFAIADGATPGNEGRGYVLRRILRRAARFGRKLNLNQPFFVFTCGCFN